MERRKKLSDITPDILEALSGLKMNLGHLWQMEQFYFETGLIHELSVPLLERKGFANCNKLTEHGKRVYEGFNSGEMVDKAFVKIALKSLSQIKDAAFDEWWESFPASDNFEYKGVRFSGCRSFKVGKSSCKNIFKNIVDVKEFSEEEIINATKVHIQHMKEQSLKLGTNKMSFLVNSERYLNERMFQGYVGLQVKEEPKNNSTYHSGVSI